MNRAVNRRLAKLEAHTAPPRAPRGFCANVEQDDATFEQWRADLIASGEAVETDVFIRLVFIDTQQRGVLQ